MKLEKIITADVVREKINKRNNNIKIMNEYICNINNRIQKEMVENNITCFTVIIDHDFTDQIIELLNNAKYNTNILYSYEDNTKPNCILTVIEISL